MPKFAANLSWLFLELDFLDRFEAAANAGFTAVEYLFPYDYDRRLLADKLAEHGLKQALFNMHPGDWDKGERGLSILPERQEDFKESVAMAIAYAEALSCPKIHCMAGLIPDDGDLYALERTYVSNLRFIAEEAAETGIDVVIEPINSVDMPGYYLNYTDQAAEIIDKVGADNLFIQYDIYHAQKMEGNLAATMEKHWDKIGHIQVADNPLRHEPGTGEINFDFLFRHLDALGYEGYVGCEYKPASGTVDGLGWVKSYL